MFPKYTPRSFSILECTLLQHRKCSPSSPSSSSWVSWPKMRAERNAHRCTHASAHCLCFHLSAFLPSVRIVAGVVEALRKMRDHDISTQTAHSRCPLPRVPSAHVCVYLYVCAHFCCRQACHYLFLLPCYVLADDVISPVSLPTMRLNVVCSPPPLPLKATPLRALM